MTTTEISAWFAGRLPQEWFGPNIEVTTDADEILVVGQISAPDAAKDLTGDAELAALAGATKRFREDTRVPRMKIADEAEALFGRKVAWGVKAGVRTEIFTSMAIPVMTRLRIAQRSVLDTLVESGVARSRSEALVWCVKLVADHESEWLQDLTSALTQVQEVRAKGPASTRA